jgi:hypothetical protein
MIKSVLAAIVTAALLFKDSAPQQNPIGQVTEIQPLALKMKFYIITPFLHLILYHPCMYPAGKA